MADFFPSTSTASACPGLLSDSGARTTSTRMLVGAKNARPFSSLETNPLRISTSAFVCGPEATMGAEVSKPALPNPCTGEMETYVK